MGSVSPAAHSTSKRASPRHDPNHEHSQKEQGSYDRASLDIPRRPSPWIGAKETSRNEGTKAIGPPVTPRNERPRSAMFHRPSSTTSTSLSFAPPLVTVVSPKSPAKSVHLSHVSSVPYLPSPKSSTTSGLGSRPAPPVPPHAVRPNISLQVQSSRPDIPLEKNAAVKSPIPVRKPNIASTLDTALANLPPPINRADKPKLPDKPLDSKSKPTLEPEILTKEERLSPFSTPPSRDESQSKNFQLNGSNALKPLQTTSPKGFRASPFSPPPTTGSVRDWSRMNFDPALSGSVHTISGVDRAGTIAQDAGGARPGLPPRRSTEKGPQQHQIIRTNEARIASTGKISRQVSQPITMKPTVPSRTRREVPPPSGFLPPPKRSGTGDSSDTSKTQEQTDSPLPGPSFYPYDTNIPAETKSELPPSAASLAEYPNASQSNRRPPDLKQGIQEIDTNYDTRLFDFCGDFLCTTGYLTRAWDLSTGSVIMNLGHGEQTKVTAMAFKPGATAEEEGLCLWMGTNFGDLYEVDIPTQSVISTRSSTHSRREVVKIYRHQNTMWTLDDGGNLYVWPPDTSGLPNFQGNPTSHRVPKGHTFSLVIHRRLWLATGKEIRIFSPGSPDSEFALTTKPLVQQNVGDVTSGAVISTQHDRVYFGHSDGKITVYSIDDFSCLGVINLSVYKINALAGAGGYLWAGYNTGMIYVYDTEMQPWRTKKDWQAHSQPVANIMVDRSSVWKSGSLQVASIGTDNAVRIWDGMLEEDWLGSPSPDV